MRIVPGDFGDPQVVALLDTHVTTARAKTAHGSAHALDLTALQSPAIAFWTTWEGETLLGCGALKRLSATHGELKSMHTAQAARRRGAGAAMLAHLIDEARAAKLTRLSLETGAWDFFIPARALYARHGFMECQPFEGYKPDPNSVFMTLELIAQA
jgi:putative acetyltransferase